MKPLPLHFVLIGLFVLLSACSKSSVPAEKDAKAGMPPPEVEVTSPRVDSPALQQNVMGRAAAYRTAEIRARVDGIVAQRLFQEGSVVKAGAPLFKIDAYVTAADLAAAEAEYQFNSQKLERLRPLLAKQAVSQQEFDLANLQTKQSHARWQKLQQDWRNASAPAPISGFVGRALVSEGALVKQSEATLLARIEQTNPIYVDFEESAALMLQLKHELKQGKLRPLATPAVQVVLPDGSLYSRSGKLLFSDASVNPNNGNIRMRAVFDNPEQVLLPNMLLKVQFAQSQRQQVMLIPQAAVSAGPKGTAVMLVGEDNKVMPRPVQLGDMVGTDFIVLKGLKGDEKLIVNGLQKARPGTEVKIAPAHQQDQ